jgi:hypothetical protein
MIDPSGKPVATFMTSAAAGASPGSQAKRSGASGATPTTSPFAALQLGSPRGVDAQGRMYFRSMSIQFGRGGQPAANDSTPVIRWDRTTNGIDTVGLVPNPPAKITASGSGAGGPAKFMVRMGPKPFASTDAFAVTPQGVVAIVRADDYHVDWIANGKILSGPPNNYTPVKITSSDKSAYIESRKSETGIIVMQSPAGRSVRTVPQSEMQADDLEFPEYKGPFRTVLAAPDGRLWVERYMPAGTPPTYDIIDKSGKVVSRAILPSGTRLIGFGKRSAYLVRTDEDDLQHLQRYRM